MTSTSAWFDSPLWARCGRWRKYAGCRPCACFGAAECGYLSPGRRRVRARGGSMDCAGREHRSTGSVRGPRCPPRGRHLLLHLTAPVTRRPRQLACRGRRRNPPVPRIGPVGRAAKRNQGGGSGRRPAPGGRERSSAPRRPDPTQPDRQESHSRTTAKGRKKTFASQRLLGREAYRARLVQLK